MLIKLRSLRDTQALSHGRYRGVYEEPGICAVACGAYAHTWDLEEAGDLV